ncbi:MAG: ElyC/SanA/YdcF family protein [Bacilli bacterium]|nr:ElyC/SanA/YdcF family protein [Bacilli bacterium]
MKKLLKIIILVIILILIINYYVIISTKKDIYTIDNINITDADCILILGASIRNNQPSPMLKDRLTEGINLYNSGVSKKILVSGDHMADDYDEVNVMKNYLIENDIPSEDIFMDHNGISSYDSIYRAKKIYNVNKIVIVTQKYHLYRSLYIAKKLDIDAYGISSVDNEYSGQTKRDMREFLARIKDFFKCIIKPESKYLGEVYNINGNGDKTNK